MRVVSVKHQLPSQPKRNPGGIPDTMLIAVRADRFVVREARLSPLGR